MLIFEKIYLLLYIIFMFKTIFETIKVCTLFETKNIRKVKVNTFKI